MGSVAALAVRASTASPETELVSALEAAAALPASPRAAFTIPSPRRLARPDGVSRWAPVLRAVTVRSSPGPRAPLVERLGVRTPENTANLVPILGRRLDRHGGLWVRVRVPALPDNVEGWVPRAVLGGYSLVRTRLVIDLARLEATLYRGGRRVLRAPIGVGTPDSPTPRGEFYIRNKLSAYRSPFYGPVAFGTSARSRVLTDWPGGGFIGIHGTDRPDLLPGRVSHGCVRLRNDDIVRLARLMPVGTPVTIS